MKRISKKFLFIGTGIIIIILIGYSVWQKYKYKFVRNTVTTTIAEKTDSLYSIKYDSLSFSAITGEATIKNIRIIPDTNRAKKLIGENLPDILLDVKIKSITLTGVKTAKALKGNKLEGDSVIIDDPLITMYSMRSLQKGTKIESDVGNVYKQILGKLDLIKVDFVFVNNVNVKGIDFNTKETNFNFINGKFLLENVLIDSAHHEDTNRVLFCKQAAFTVDSFFSYNHNRKELSVKDINFLGKQKEILFDEISVNRFENDTSAGIRLLDAKTLKLSGVNSNEIVKNKNFLVDTILCKQIYVYELPLQNLKTTKGNGSENKDSSGFNNVYGVNMRHLYFPNVTFIPFAESKFKLGNIAIKVNGVKSDQFINLQLHPMDYIKEVEVKVNSFSILSKDKAYNLEFKDITLNSLQKDLKINSYHRIPFAPEKQFVNKYHFQKDRYDIKFSGIALSGIDMNSLLDKSLEASELNINKINAKIYRDLHKPLEKKSKVGNYVSQLLKKLKQPINISKATINNAFIEYRENEKISDSIGVIDFSNTHIVITNITNIPSLIQKNNELNMSFDTRILETIPLKGNFKFLLDGNDGNFMANGHITEFDALKLNKVSVPMGLIKINSGKINSINFNFTGNNTSAKGEMVMKYEGLKVTVLKRDKDTKEIKKRGLATLAANLIVKNDNPGNNGLRKVTPHNDRDINKSFFNLVWKTLFSGMKETVGIP